MDEREEPRTMDLQQYVRILVKRRFQMLAVAALIIAVVTAAVFLKPRSYEASTTVSIEENYLNMLMRDMAVDPTSQDRVQALSVVMTSRSMLLPVLTGLGVDLKSKTEVETEKLVKYFQKNTQIRFEPGRAGRGNMDLFTVTYRDRNPRFARDYVNAIVGRYVAQSRSRSKEDVLAANRFVSEQMELYKNKIDRTESQLAERRKETGVQAAERLAALRKKYDGLLGQYTSRHPDVIRLRDEIASAEADLQRQRMPDRPAAGQRTIADLERDRDAYQRVYDSLVASIGKSEVSAKVEAQANDNTFKILEPAVLPIQPVGQPRWKLLLLGFVGGIAGGVVTVILLDMNDRSIRGPGPVKAMGLQVLAMVPRIETAQATAAQRRKDLLAYGAAGIYAASVLALVVIEYLSNS